ncbi:MAG TPA: N-methyl-L-tryptophan oxidase [Candidatus Dormibacteraeota bacterium]
MPVRSADVIVVGAGTMGSFALWRLARRGASVLGLEQFAPGHDRGSGHGESRMIRTAYFEGPDYVPLVTAAFPLWRELETESETELLTMTGALMIGRPDGVLLTGALHSAREHALAYELLEPRQVAARFAPHRLAPDEVALWEEGAGVLRPELAIRAAAGRARALGATLVTGTRVTGVEARDGGVTVRAGGAVYRGRHLVVCAGPWLGGLLPGLGLPLRVERQVMTWFPAPDPAPFAPGRFPCFIHDREDRLPGYGIPSLDGATVKVGLHHGGRLADPDTLDRQVTGADVAPLTELVEETLRGLDTRPARAAVCMYTNTPDEHFVVGPAPELPGVTVLGGFSGHGFKFAPVMGEIAADLALEGGTAHPIAGFSPQRFRQSAGCRP